MVVGVSVVVMDVLITVGMVVAEVVFIGTMFHRLSRRYTAIVFFIDQKRYIYSTIND